MHIAGQKRSGFDDLIREQLLRLIYQLPVTQRTIAASVVLIGLSGVGVVMIQAAPHSEPASPVESVRPREHRWRVGSVAELGNRAATTQTEVSSTTSEQSATNPSVVDHDHADDPVITRLDELRARMQSERADHDAQLLFRGVVEGRTDSSIAVDELTCVLSTCRVTLRIDSDDPSVAVAQLVGGEPFTEGPGGSVEFPGEASGDLSVAVVHFVRPGHPLPPE